MIGDAVLAAAMGVGLGAATGVPLGVVNVSVVEAATRVGRGHATGIGLGGALADAVHAGLAFAGIAPWMGRHPAAMRVLAVASAAIVVGYAAWVWRGRTSRAGAPAGPAPARRTGVGGGIALGVALTLPNPAPLAAWIAVAGALWPHATPEIGAAAAAGVGVGSALWFALLAWLAARGAERARGATVTRWLPRVVAVALVAIAAVAVARALAD